MSEWNDCEKGLLFDEAATFIDLGIWLDMAVVPCRIGLSASSLFIVRGFGEIGVGRSGEDAGEETDAALYDALCIRAITSAGT